MEGSLCVAPQFWKMVYENFMRKPFSKILHYVFRSTENIFNLTIFYKQANTTNTKNVFQKIFYSKTNGALLLRWILSLSLSYVPMVTCLAHP